MEFKRQKVVIFGGPDRCGKTTIAKELSRLTGIPYFKPTGQRSIAIKHPKLFEDQTRWAEPRVQDLLAQTGYSVIIDRSFPCDWAYSHVLGRQTAWSTIDVLDTSYGEMDAMLVLTLRRDYRDLKDDAFEAIDTEKLWALDELYRTYAVGTKMNVLILETDDEDLKRQTDTILEHMREIDE